MPELPEVENIKLQLSKFLIGHTIKDVDVRYKKCFSGDVKNILGAKIRKIRRFGKVLVIDTNKGSTLVIHVKMTGQLIYRGSNLEHAPKLSEKVLGGLDGKHTHVIFHLDNPPSSRRGRTSARQGGKLYFNDVRKFGWIKTVKSLSLRNQIKFIKKLGPEPLGDLTLKKFKEILGSTSRSIKTLLMDQSRISGIGNIYANDALWVAKINPQREAKSLKREEIKKLFNAIEKVLRDGIKRGGASDQRFVRPDGTEGNYQDFTYIYGRKDEPCKRCGGKIKKTKISGRGTFFCPRCQM